MQLFGCLRPLIVNLSVGPPTRAIDYLVLSTFAHGELSNRCRVFLVNKVYFRIVYDRLQRYVRHSVVDKSLPHMLLASARLTELFA